MPETKRLNIDFPHEEYGYLKLMCHKLNLSMKDFCTKKLIDALEEDEDILMAQQMDELIKNSKPDDFIPWEEAKTLMGMDV